MKVIKKAAANLEEYLIAGIMAYLAVIVMAQVVMRHVFGNALSWSEESLRFIFIWMIMLGFSAGVKKESHIRVVLLFNKLKGRAQFLVQELVHLIFFATAAIVFVLGLKSVASFLEFPQVSPALGIPMQYIYLACPVGFGLTMIRLVQRMFIDAKRFWAGEFHPQAN